MTYSFSQGVENLTLFNTQELNMLTLFNLSSDIVKYFPVKLSKGITFFFIISYTFHFSLNLLHFNFN